LLGVAFEDEIRVVVIGLVVLAQTVVFRIWQTLSVAIDMTVMVIVL